MSAVLRLPEEQHDVLERAQALTAYDLGSLPAFAIVSDIIHTGYYFYTLLSSVAKQT